LHFLSSASRFPLPSSATVRPAPPRPRQGKLETVLLNSEVKFVVCCAGGGFARFWLTTRHARWQQICVEIAFARASFFVGFLPVHRTLAHFGKLSMSKPPMSSDFALGLVAVGPILPDSSQLEPRNPCRVRDAPIPATHPRTCRVLTVISWESQLPGVTTTRFD
jgi:hypothetical protein